MKLTDGQIEIEKVKFCKAHKEICKYVPTFNGDKCLSGLANERWLIWLACRESCNEIQIPDEDYYDNPNGGGFHYIDSGLLIKLLESQGFTVKSQE